MGASRLRKRTWHRDSFLNVSELAGAPSRTRTLGRVTASLHQCPLDHLLTIPPRPAAAALILRAGRFLSAVGEIELRTLAWQVEYTREEHDRGVYLYGFASRQRSYGAWLADEELDPRRDPGHPRLLQELEGLVDDLRVRAGVAMARHIEEPQRTLAFSVVLDHPQGRTRVSLARRRLVPIRHLADLPFDGAEAAAAQLARDGSAAKRARAEWTLLRLQCCIRAAPIDEERRADILADVMRHENDLASWFTAASARFRGAATAAQLQALGLGELPEVAAPMGSVRRFSWVCEA